MQFKMDTTKLLDSYVCYNSNSHTLSPACPRPTESGSCRGQRVKYLRLREHGLNTLCVCVVSVCSSWSWSLKGLQVSGAVSPTRTGLEED